jgi:putative transcriptional regulator
MNWTAKRAEVYSKNGGTGNRTQLPRALQDLYPKTREIEAAIDAAVSGLYVTSRATRAGEERAAETEHHSPTSPIQTRTGSHAATRSRPTCKRDRIRIRNQRKAPGVACHRCDQRFLDSAATRDVSRSAIATNERRQADLTFNSSHATMSLESELDMSLIVRNRIKELRSGRGWTQQQLAEAAGVSRQSINSIERDRYIPSLLLALTFARVFACSTDNIFTLEIEP